MCLLVWSRSIERRNGPGQTEGGVGLGCLIKPGMLHVGEHRMSGIVAGDEECFTSFKRLFDPVVDQAFPSLAVHFG
jgi:hypothetical protein